MNNEQAINKITEFLKEYENLCKKYGIGISCHDDEDWIRLELSEEESIQLYNVRYDHDNNCIICNNKKINELKKEDFEIW